MSTQKEHLVLNDQYPELLLQIMDEAMNSSLDISDKYLLFKFAEFGETISLWAIQGTTTGMEHLGISKVTFPDNGLSSSLGPTPIDSGIYQGEISVCRTRTSGIVTAISSASPAVVTCATHGLADGNEILMTVVVGMTEVNNRMFTVKVIDANSFQLVGENSSSHTAYASAGTWYKFGGIQTISKNIRFKVRGDLRV